MLLITHDLGVARLMSDRIFVMKQGRFVEGGDADDTLAQRPERLHPNACSTPSPTGAWNEPRPESRYPR